VSPGRPAEIRVYFVVKLLTTRKSAWLFADLMGFIKVLFKLLAAVWAALCLTIVSIGAIIGVFGAPQFVYDKLEAIGESPAAVTGWQLAILAIDTIWYLFTEHTVLVVIVFVTVALLRYLWGGSKDSMEQEYEKVRQSFRHRNEDS
jgi:hypothetical protein